MPINWVGIIVVGAIFVSLAVGILYIGSLYPKPEAVTFVIAEKMIDYHMGPQPRYLFVSEDGEVYEVSKEDFERYEVGDEYTVSR